MERDREFPSEQPGFAVARTRRIPRHIFRCSIDFCLFTKFPNRQNNRPCQSFSLFPCTLWIDNSTQTILQISSFPRLWIIPRLSSFLTKFHLNDIYQKIAKPHSLETANFSPNFYANAGEAKRFKLVSLSRTEGDGAKYCAAGEELGVRARPRLFPCHQKLTQNILLLYNYSGTLETLDQGDE